MILCYDYRSKNTYPKVMADTIKYHLESLGIRVFDEHTDEQLCPGNMLLRDNDIYQMNIAFSKEQYVVLILSQGLCNDITALVELDIIEKLFEAGKIKVFTVIYDMDIKELPFRLLWLKNTRVFRVQQITDMHDICMQMAKKYWEKKLRVESEREVTELFEKETCETVKRLNDSYVKVLIKMYRELDFHSVDMRMLLLNILLRYLMLKEKSLTNSKSNIKCVNRIFEDICSSRPCSQTELEMLNFCIIDMLACV